MHKYRPIHIAHTPTVDPFKTSTKKGYIVGLFHSLPLYRFKNQVKKMHQAPWLAHTFNIYAIASKKYIPFYYFALCEQVFFVMPSSWKSKRTNKKLSFVVYRRFFSSFLSTICKHNRNIALNRETERLNCRDRKMKNDFPKLNFQQH